ncbi:serine O-acetyltransferase [Cerasicoccus maritimus]|uniref:serine O-acetyltransferase n=1 Tax=Cerasicoccus maritimus TaxID=490089 RepID=UPI002852994E|nr:serine O-acetyltransferase [Cerasicoccus maritimus]
MKIVKLLAPISCSHQVLPMQAEELWQELWQEAEIVARREPALSGLMNEVILLRHSLQEALSVRLSRKLAYHATPEGYLKGIFTEAFDQDPTLIKRIVNDIVAVNERDPACPNPLYPVLYFKGFQALTCYRIAHHLLSHNREDLAFYLQSLISEVFAVDIHPAARIGSGILLDHATSFVAGETAVIEDDVSILHEVTLGGTGKERGDRHPKIRHGVLIGAGAKLLGNIEIGQCAKIGAGSVVLNDIPAHSTAVGVPARVIGVADEDEPCRMMDHRIRSTD